jgi:hypothetical protein
MKNLIVTRYMRLLEPLTIDIKLELLSRLSASLKKNFVSSTKEKERLLEELSGSWSDVEDELIEDIRLARTTSEKDINLD